METLILMGCIRVVVTMTDDDTTTLPSAFIEAMRTASTDAATTQQEVTEAMLGADETAEEFPLDAVRGTATFKTRIQSGGRITIPDAEREVLDLEDGDIVQAVIVPLKRTSSED